MREYREVYKNIKALSCIIVLGFCFILMGIVLLCVDYIIIGAIFTAIVLIAVAVILGILIKNCTLSKVRIDKSGITIKEKSSLQFIAWEEFTDCKITHKGQGGFEILLYKNEQVYKLLQGLDIVDFMIQYCSSPMFIDILKLKRNNC